MRNVLCLSVVMVALLLEGAAGRAAESADQPVVITLRAAATVSASQVTLGDVATLQGGAADRRERLARLDLTEMPLSSEPILVSQHQVGFRLQLAGLEAGAFRVEGARYTRVSRPTGEALDEKIATTARQAVEQKLPGHADDMAIQLAGPVRLPPLAAEGEDIHLEAELRSPPTVPGRALVEVAVYVRSARRLSLPVLFDIKKVEPVPVALRRIEAGEAFSPENYRVERLSSDNNQKATVSAGDLEGRRARRPIAPGRPIEPDDVESVTRAAVVIHQNDLVHLIAKVGPLQVKARGEAMQNGQAGQFIQVRNVDSRAVITGRVVDSSTVEVDY
jgi:flagella basal body P-ring formation protein FlgA